MTAQLKIEQNVDICIVCMAVIQLIAEAKLASQASPHVYKAHAHLAIIIHSISHHHSLTCHSSSHVTTLYIHIIITYHLSCWIKDHLVRSIKKAYYSKTTRQSYSLHK